MIVNSRTLNKIISRSENLQRTLLDLTEDTVDETNLSRGETAHDKEGDSVIGRFQIDDAEAWAIGTRNGVLVSEDDITHHNNSKYYSQMSEAAAAVSGSAMMVAGSYADAAELSALTSADSARMSENYEIISGSYMNIAGSYMNIAGERAEDSEAFAMGKRGGTLVPPSDPTYHNNSKYYYEQSKSIAESLGGVLRPKGTCLFAELPLIAESQSGDVWNIEDEFTTTSDFREGAGRIVAAGSNVYLTVDRKWDVLAGTTSDYIGATSSTAAIHGLVNPAQAGQEKAVYRGDGTWGTVDDTLDPSSSNLIENQAIANPIEAIVNVYGSKNLCPNNAVTKVQNGITYTVNSDGSITVNGTATANSQIDFDAYIVLEKNKQYTFTAGVSEAITGINFIIGGFLDNAWSLLVNTNNPKVNFTFPNKNGNVRAFIQVKMGAVLNDVTFKIMVRDIRIQDDTYVPYAMTNRELTYRTNSQILKTRAAKQDGANISTATNTVDLHLNLSADEDIAFFGFLMVKNWDSDMSNAYIGALFCRQNTSGFDMADIKSNATHKPTISYNKDTQILSLTFSSSAVRFVRFIYS